MKKLPLSAAAVGLALAFAAPASAQSGVVVADHLNNPRQFDVSPGGVVYVAEAGRGGTKCAGAGEERFCAGFTSGITRVAPGKPSRVVSGLFSGAGPDGSFATGVDAMAVSPFGGFVGIEAGGGEVPGLGGSRIQPGALLQLSPFNRGGAPRAIAQLDDYEFATNPAGDQLDSNPYGVDATDDAFYVTDAAGNSLLKVTRGGEISTVATFADIGPSDAVPTSVRVGPDGALYVGTLAEGAGPGGAKVYRVVPGQAPTVYADGLTTVVGLDFDDAGNLYVAELFANTVERITPSGERTSIGDGELQFPGGVAIGNDGSIFVSNFGVLPAYSNAFGPGANGQVVKFPPVS